MSLTEADPHRDVSETETHAAGIKVAPEAHGGHDDHAAHGAAGGHAHGASSQPLGPIDRPAWAAAIGGAAIGLLVILALYLAISA